MILFSKTLPSSERSTSFEEFICMMIKLRTNQANQDSSYYFGTSTCTISRILLRPSKVDHLIVVSVPIFFVTASWFSLVFISHVTIDHVITCFKKWLSFGSTWKMAKKCSTMDYYWTGDGITLSELFDRIESLYNYNNCFITWHGQLDHKDFQW